MAELESLEREGLFLVPLDDHREWFRFHGLFGEFLRGGLRRRRPEDVAALHLRTTRWYLAHDLPEPAFRHAVDGDDVELVARIVEDYVNSKLLAGEVKVVRRWLESIPEAWFALRPELDLARAGSLFFTGHFEASVRCLDDVESRIATTEREDVREHRARVTAVRCYIACSRNDVARAEAFAAQALRDLPESDLGFRPGVFAALGDTYRQNGRWDEARECYLKTLGFAHSPGVRVESVQVFGALADLGLRQGRLREAASFWRKALAVIQDQTAWGHYSLPVIGWVDIRLGEILYEWNELAEAEGYVRLFADLGLSITRLLQEARARGVMTDYVGKLQWAIESHLSFPATTPGALLEPLSVREQEVLRLIAAGQNTRNVPAPTHVKVGTSPSHEPRTRRYRTAPDAVCWMRQFPSPLSPLPLRYLSWRPLFRG